MTVRRNCQIKKIRERDRDIYIEREGIERAREERNIDKRERAREEKE